MEQAAKMAESVVNGQTVGLLENLAKELDCYLVAGLPELDGERLYNSAVLIGPDGLLADIEKCTIMFLIAHGLKREMNR